MSNIPEPPTSAAVSCATDAPYASRDERLALPGGRTLAYSLSGPRDSELVVLWCHGLFNLGDAMKPNQAFRDRGVHFIAPDLPGWGGTSPMPAGATFPEVLLSDLRALFEHLYPTYDAAASKLRIYVAGVSCGTCAAQVVCGAPYDKFPYGRHIVAVLLVEPLTPFCEDAQYTRSLTWAAWVCVGPPARVLPFNLLARMMKSAIQPRLKDVPTAEKLVRAESMDRMTNEEKAAFAEWRARAGVREGEFERWVAERAVRSVSKSWAGFLGTADVLHGDWGFKIKDLDEEHARKKVVMMVKRGETRRLSYLVENYKNTKVIEIDGDDLAAAFCMDRIWEDTFGELEGDLLSA